MILLSLGTHQQPFTRALDLMEPLAQAGETLVIQHGSTPPRPSMPNTTWVEFMAFEKVMDTMSRAESIVCHAGVGTIITALKTGHKPIVIPRRARYGEHVDDHQLDIATRFAERGLIHCVTSQTEFATLLARVGDDPGQGIGNASAELRIAVASAVAAGPRRGRLSLLFR